MPVTSTFALHFMLKCLILSTSDLALFFPLQNLRKFLKPLSTKLKSKGIDQMIHSKKSFCKGKDIKKSFSVQEVGQWPSPAQYKEAKRRLSL